MADEKRDLEQELAGYFAAREADARAADATVRRIAGHAPAVAAQAPQRSSALPVLAAAAVVLLCLGLGYWLVAAPRESVETKRAVAGESEKPGPKAEDTEPGPGVPSAEMVDAAKLAYEGSVIAYERGLGPIENKYLWSCRWLQTACATAKGDEAIRVLYEEHLKRMEQALKFATAQEKAGRATKLDVHASTYYAEEARLWTGKGTRTAKSPVKNR